MRLLTLSTGQVIQLTAKEIYTLTEKPANFLDKGLYRLTAAEADGTRKEKSTHLKSLTLQFPSGRCEVISKPEKHDGEEANEDYKNALIKKITTIRGSLKTWMDKLETSAQQTEDMGKSRAALGETLDDIKRKAYLLAPSRITSPQGGVLDLKWEGVKGHVRLSEVLDADTCLLRAKHSGPEISERYTSEFKVWPGTPEAYSVKLTIKDCLLTTLERFAEGQSDPVQKVTYGYEADKALDRVLTSIEEEDGSLERVSYLAPVNQQPMRLEVLDMWDFSDQPAKQELSTPLPKAAHHILVPGAGQPTITHAWTWLEPQREIWETGVTDLNHLLDVALALVPPNETGSVERLLAGHPDTSSFTERSWDTHYLSPRPLRIIEQDPDYSRSTTTHTYPAATAKSAPELSDEQKATRNRLAALPIKTEVLEEDLQASTTEEKTA